MATLKETFIQLPCVHCSRRLLFAYRLKVAGRQLMPECNFFLFPELVYKNLPDKEENQNHGDLERALSILANFPLLVT